MSRLTNVIKAARNIRLGKVVTRLVVLAEDLLGGGTGSLKKALVVTLVQAVLKTLERAGSKVPENAPVLVDELIEQAVDLMNQSGAFTSPDAPGAAVVVDTTVPAAPAAAPKRNRGGRPQGSKNR